MDIFGGLNDKQIEAVKAPDGPVLILAGAGSGKTKTLTHRIAYLLDRGVRPENILAVTFTNKAAEEMKKRIARLISENPKPPQLGDLFIGTFHSFGAKILREEIECLGYGKNFVIYDEDDAAALAKEITENMNLGDRFKPASFLNLVSKIKSELENGLPPTNDFYKKQFDDFYRMYAERLKAANAVDFDDLINLPVKIFKSRPDILEKYREKFRHILIDEYQDTNRAQYVLTNLLAEKRRDIFAIGDPDQAIYGWRHADFRNILNFERDYPNALVIKLEQNYRSTKNILDAAHEIIVKNAERKDKKLWTENLAGDSIEIVEASSERQEAEFIADEIKRLNKTENIGLDEMVVIYRTNAQSRVLEEACLYANLPYRIVGGVKFYQRKEIKDVMAYLRLIQNPSDEVSLKRIVGITGKRAFAANGPAAGWEELKESAKNLPPAELIKSVVKKTGYRDYLEKKFPDFSPDGELESESRFKNIKELIGLAGIYGDLGEFLHEVSLMQTERDSGKGKLLNLMTLHSAKGLEFEAVFIAGAEENLMPHSRSSRSLEELEEERRLCYVGMTRAKKRLYLSFAKRRFLWGEKKENPPSRFLMELPPTLVNFRSLADGYNLPEMDIEKF